MKKNALRAVLLLLILFIPAINSFRLFEIYKDTGFVKYEDVSVFAPSAYSVIQVEKTISDLLEIRAREEAEKKLQQEREENFDNFLNDIQNGSISFRQVFSDCLIVGDSLMQGLNTYRVLDSSNMISMVSASLYHLEGNLSRIIANNPAKLVTHYGINMLIDSESYLNSFISQYERIINKLKSELPDTDIYISGIFNVSPSVERSYPCIDKYNLRLSEMCDRLDVYFVDNSECLPADGKYYGSDGIHVSKSFYTDVWLPHLYYEVYLK